MRNIGQIIALVALLLLFPWLTATLLSNMALVPSASPGIQSILIGPVLPNFGDGGSITIQPSIVQAPGQMELIALAAIASLTMAIITLRWAKQRKEYDYRYQRERPKGSRLTSFAPLGIIAVIFYVLVTLLKNPTLLMGYNQEVFSAVFIDIAVVVILVSSAVGLFLFFLSNRPAGFRRGVAVYSVDVEKAKISDILGKTIRKFELGSDYRAAILSCYQAICQTLDRDGKMYNSKLTAREFECLVASRLNVGRTYLHEATMLFEKARYSKDAIGEGDVRRSQTCLEKLQEEVQTSPCRPIVGG